MIYLLGPSGIYGDEWGCDGPGVTSTTRVPCYADDSVSMLIWGSVGWQAGLMLVLSLYLITLLPLVFLLCIAAYLACCVREKSSASSESSSVSYLQAVSVCWDTLFSSVSHSCIYSTLWFYCIASYNKYMFFLIYHSLIPNSRCLTWHWNYR